jgi:phosphopantothenoylcysteine decarboxylase/phosphopantothenate--cysteine ligase
MRLLITAGPTHEPIDAVRFLGNRSSGRLGAALAESAADLDWDVRTLIGPHADLPDIRDRSIDIRRFRSTADLEALLAEHLPWCDMLIMAAAVSDFTPVVPKNAKSTKWRRGSKALTLELTPTPDLLKGCSERARGDQILVGFALEPAETMLASARAKLERKGIDFIVANPLETMDADRIAASLLQRGGEILAETPGPILKSDFAGWLLDQLDAAASTTARSADHRTAHE